MTSRQARTGILLTDDGKIHCVEEGEISLQKISDLQGCPWSLPYLLDLSVEGQRIVVNESDRGNDYGGIIRVS
jgi:hypothetical protein